MNLLEIHARRLLATLGIAVRYVRGEQEYTLTAVPAGTAWNDINRMGNTSVCLDSRDYIARKSDLPIDPIPKDKIIDGDDTWTVYKIAGEECWRFCGPGKELIRIHCKK